MEANRYRVIDTDGSEVGFIDDHRPYIAEEEAVTLPDGSLATIVEVYDERRRPRGWGRGNARRRRALTAVILACLIPRRGPIRV